MNGDFFTTHDTALAAYLISQGFELLDTDFSNPNSVVFCFEKDSKALEEAVKSYQVGTAEGNISAFHRAYRKLIKRVRIGTI